jgi:hypothetical protein
MTRARDASSFARSAVATSRKLGAAGMLVLASCSSATASRGEDAGSDAAPGNHALHFDGAMDYATCGTAGVVAGNQPQTISMWMRYASNAGRQTIISLRRSFQTGVQVGIRDGDLAVWNVYGDDVLVETALPSAGNWHHVAYVLDVGDGGGGTNQASLYVDGNLGATSAASPNYLTPLSCWIGSVDGQSELYAGDLDELRIWSVARSSDGVASDMAGTVPSNTPGLVAYFDCNAIVGSRVPDATGYGNDMTLGGGDPAHMPSSILSTVPPDQ